MAQYISRSTTVEARTYDGDLPLTVVHDDMGEQVARKGDWLVGSERGKIQVLSPERFNARFEPFTASPTDDALKTAEEQNAELSAEVNKLKGEVETQAGQIADLTHANAELGAKVGDTESLTAQVADLSAKLEASESKAAEDEAKLGELAAAQKASQNAQAVIDAAQAKLNQQLG